MQPLTTTLPLLPKMYEYEGNQKKKKLLNNLNNNNVHTYMFNLSNCNFSNIDYSPQLMFSVKDVIHPSRVAAILFPLHPARMLHILFFSLGGSLSAWWFLGIRNEEDGYFTKVSEKYVD